MRYLDSISIPIGLLLSVSLAVGISPEAACASEEGSTKTSSDPDGQAPTLVSATVAGGGGEIVTSESFRMVGTVGPPDAGTASSASYQVAGGFAGSGSVGNPDPIFGNGFETGNTDGWDNTAP